MRGETVETLLDPINNRLTYRGREVGWQIFANFRYCSGYRVHQVVDKAPNDSRRKTRPRSGLLEVPWHNFSDTVMPVAAYRHCEAHSFLLELSGGKQGLGGHDIVKRDQGETACWMKRNTEILGVTIRRSEDPEGDLGFQEGFLVNLGAVSSFQELNNL